MKDLIKEIKDKLQRFDNKQSEDLFFLIGNFKHLEKILTQYNDEGINQTFKFINKILKQAFNQNILEDNNIFELLQETLYIQKFINDLEKKSSSNKNNNKVRNVAIGVGLTAMGFAVGKAFINSNRSSKNLENPEILTISYYLSRYDHDNLFDHPISAAKAIENIAKILNIKPNTLRNKRDYFDTFLNAKGIKTKSERKGYSNAKLTKLYDEIINQYHSEKEEKIRTKIISILNNYSNI